MKKRSKKLKAKPVPTEDNSLNRLFKKIKESPIEPLPAIDISKILQEINEKFPKSEQNLKTWNDGNCENNENNENN